MAVVQVPQFYDASNFSNADLIPFWRETDGSMFNITYDELFVQIESSLGGGVFVQKSGDTMTGPLVISSGGLVVNNDVSIGGNLIIDGSLFVRSVEAIDVSSAFIVLNTGQTGTPPASMQSGIVVDRGDLEPYVFLYDESTEDFRVGVAAPTTGPSFDDSSTQAVATREDTPLDGGVALWNAALNRFDTSTYSGGGGDIWQEDSSNNVTLTDPSNNVVLSMVEIAEDSGANIQFLDMPVSATPAADTEESYTFDMDGSTALKVYGTATGSGAVKEIGVVVEANYQYMGDPNTNGSWRFYVDGSSNLTFEKRTGGSWVFGGQFT